MLTMRFNQIRAEKNPDSPSVTKSEEKTLQQTVFFMTKPQSIFPSHLQHHKILYPLGVFPELYKRTLLPMGIDSQLTITGIYKSEAYPTVLIRHVLTVSEFQFIMKS